MKKIIMALAIAAVTMTSTAYAANPTVSKRQVSYKCQHGKKVNITYGFNKQNLPTYASASLNGRVRQLPINLDTSDATASNFGQDGGYMIGADYFEKSSVRQASVMVTAPSGEILFKDCNAR